MMAQFGTLLPVQPAEYDLAGRLARGEIKAWSEQEVEEARLAIREQRGGRVYDPKLD